MTRVFDAHLLRWLVPIAACITFFLTETSLLVAAQTTESSDAETAPATDETLAATNLAATQDSAEFFRIVPDTRLCPPPFCGGAFAALVNQSVSFCADGESRDWCYVTRVDLDSIPLLDPQLNQLRDDLYAGQALVSGRIVQVFSPVVGLSSELHVVDGWRAATDAMPQDRVFLVRDNGIRCIAAPCFSYDVVAVNSLETYTASDVNLLSVGASAEALATARSALATTGLLASGWIEDEPHMGPAGDGRMFVASQLYLPVGR